MTGKLDLIIGCMFSGKSTELIRRINREQITNEKILIVNHVIDSRYGDNIISTHDRGNKVAMCIDYLGKLWNIKNYKDSDVIFIEEAQFFPDLFDFVTKSVDRDNKRITVCGLDGDFKREPFEQVLKLIPYCDTITKLSALCKKCNNGNLANFTCRLSDSQEKEVVGGSQEYIPLCRRHYLAQLEIDEINKELELPSFNNSINSPRLF